MRYRVDASRSRFVAQAFAKGLLSAFGHNPRLAIRSFEGETEFDPAAPDAAWVRMTARADSLVVIDEVQLSFDILAYAAREGAGEPPSVE